MADLGTIPEIYEFRHNAPSPVIVITDYTVERGRPLGPILVRINKNFRPDVVSPIGYVVRQTRILYRQLWPSHGQRFPQ